MYKSIKKKVGNINMSNIAWYMTILFIMFLTVISVQMHKESPLSGISLDIGELDGSRNLISHDLAMNKIKAYFGKNVELIKWQDVDTKHLEKILSSDSRIENVQVFIDGRNLLNIKVTQRQAIARVMNEHGEDYYIDHLGTKINKVENAVLRVPIVTGQISNYHPQWKKLSAHSMNDIIKISTAISSDPFLKALIEQIHFERSDAILLIPKVGDQKLRLGTTEDLDKKLRHLKASYEKIIKNKGWDKYKEFNLEIPNQISGVKKT